MDVDFEEAGGRIKRISCRSPWGDAESGLKMGFVGSAHSSGTAQEIRRMGPSDTEGELNPGIKKGQATTVAWPNVAERMGFEPMCRFRQTDFEFYRRLLITWFLLSISVSLVRPQTRMKSGLFEKIARKY